MPFMVVTSGINLRIKDCIVRKAHSTDSMASDDKDLRSERPLTEKGQSLYESTVNKYQSRLNDS